MSITLNVSRAAPRPPITVDGVEIERAAIALEAQHHPADSPGEANRLAAEALILRHLLVQEARRHDLVPVPEVDERSRRETEDEALVRQLVEREVTVPSPSDDELRRFYRANQAAFRAQEILQARHILIGARASDPEAYAAARDKAEALAVDLAACPEHFEEFARAHSDCASSAEGGFLGQLAPGETTPEFDAAVAELNEGETSAPVATRYGFHIIRLDDRIPGCQMPFESVSQRIADYLVERSRRTAISQYLARLVSRAKIGGIDIAGAEAHRVN